MRKRAAKEKDVSVFMMFKELLFHEYFFPRLENQKMKKSSPMSLTNMSKHLPSVLHRYLRQLQGVKPPLELDPETTLEILEKEAEADAKVLTNPAAVQSLISNASDF